jgi:hypothetical protein
MYRKAVITFVDILGFKEIIASSSYEHVAKKLETVRRLSGHSKDEDGDGFDPKVIQFSDSIIRIRPLDSIANKASRYGLLYFELLDLVHLQGELINHGVCVRGGVSFGNVHFDDSTLFGPGFVRAHELESIYANYPRIVIDPELIGMLRKDKRLASAQNSVADELSYIRKNIRKGDDGIYFIDYLRSFMAEIEKPKNVTQFLANHRQVILEQSTGVSQLTPVSAKYLWMANYHNAVLAELDYAFFRSHGLKRSDLEICPKDMPLLQGVET